MPCAPIAVRAKAESLIVGNFSEWRDVAKGLAGIDFIQRDGCVRVRVAFVEPVELGPCSMRIFMGFLGRCEAEKKIPAGGFQGARSKRPIISMLRLCRYAADGAVGRRPCLLATPW